MKLVLIILVVLISQLAVSQTFYEPIANFQADKSALERKYTVTYTNEYFDRFISYYQKKLNELDKIEFSGLDVDASIDFVLFRTYLERNMYNLTLEKAEFQQISHLIDFADELYQFMSERKRGNEPNSKHIAAMMDRTEKMITEKKNRLMNSQKLDSWQKAELAAQVIQNLKVNLKESVEFYMGYDPDFTWWVDAPYKKLYQSIEGYEKWIKEFYSNSSIKDDGSGIIGKPIGKDALIKSLQSEFIPYTPEEIIKIGEKEFEWCEKEMLKASTELGFGNDWKRALEHVKNTYVPAGKWPAEINYFAEEAINFIETRDLITIPEMAKETWRMNMLSPERQLTSPFFLGGEAILIAYPTNTMDHDAKMMSFRGNNPYFSRAVVHHELIPGHHLQQFMSQRYKPYRRLFGTPFWTEGWALYWEFNLWDKGFAKSPEEKIGMLFWRMHRAARIMFSLNYHLNKMSPQQCIDFLVEKVGHERANAEAEVRRSFTGRYGPLYQIAYMLGGLQFYQLKKEWVDSGKMLEKEFHDFIMQQNNIPVELIRSALLQKQISKDFKTQWRFYP